MTRSRSGSFYCPLEPAWAPLSISQKAQISTALPPTSSVPILTERPQRRHTRTPSFRIGSDEVQQCTSSSQQQQQQHSPLSHRSESRPLFLSTPNLSSTYGFGTNAASSISILTPLPPRKRHAHSPARPSPLCGEEAVPVKPAQPSCPSAIWTSSHVHGHGIHHQRTRSSANSSSCSTLHRSVLKSAFMAGPMARKARMYGLRVAWCVFGDARVEMARDIFGRSSTSSGIVGGDMERAEVQHAESVSVEMPVHDIVFEWEPPRSSAASQDSYSYLEIDQQDSESDSDSATSSDSDYESMSDEETDSAESDDLDDEDEIHREVLAAFHQASLDSSPELGKHAQATNDDAHWEVLTFEG